jgi:hypothetical protein
MSMKNEKHMMSVLCCFYTIRVWIRREDEFVAVVELLGERFAEPLDRSIQN